jgi:hypothetical protein
MRDRVGDDDVAKRLGLKATKDTVDHSEIVSFVALSHLKKSRKPQEVDTESVHKLTLLM